MIEGFYGLEWFRRLWHPTGRHFCHENVCNRMAQIAGGDPKQYRKRASKMIAEAKAKGHIAPSEGCVRYYKFVGD